MRIAYLECFSGMSGDMFLGALVDAGVPARVLEETVAALGLGARLEISRAMRSGISAAKVDVWVDGEKDLPREEYWERQEPEHAHERSHQQHEHTDDPRHAEQRNAVDRHRLLPHVTVEPKQGAGHETRNDADDAFPAAGDAFQLLDAFNQHAAASRNHQAQQTAAHRRRE